jgi:hypothetical protein
LINDFSFPLFDRITQIPERRDRLDRLLGVLEPDDKVVLLPVRLHSDWISWTRDNGIRLSMKIRKPNLVHDRVEEDLDGVVKGDRDGHRNPSRVRKPTNIRRNNGDPKNTNCQIERRLSSISDRFGVAAMNWLADGTEEHQITIETARA